MTWDCPSCGTNVPATEAPTANCTGCGIELVKRSAINRALGAKTTTDDGWLRSATGKRAPTPPPAAASRPADAGDGRSTYQQARDEANARAAAAAAPRRKRDKRKANLGKAWEVIIGEQHERYRRDGLADIVKIENPSTPLEPPRRRSESELARFGRGGPVMLCRPEPGKHVDFSGVIIGGRACRLEAKQSRDDRIDRAAVRPHQVERLNRCDELGGFAAVLVLLPSGMWVVPWLHWTPARDPRTGKVKKSLNPADLDARGVRFAGADVASAVLAGATAGADWLTAAKAKGWC